tara:strand:- start:3 stop:203 length:201 start_codon:yes stop_codon:yes gene_type:complete
MKSIIFIFLSFLLFACSQNSESKKINIKSAELAKSKINDFNEDLSYGEYKSLIIEYGKNNKFPDLK